MIEISSDSFFGLDGLIYKNENFIRNNLIMAKINSVVNIKNMEVQQLHFIDNKDNN